MCCRLSVVWMLIPADIVLLCVCKIIDRYEQNKLNAVASHMPTHSRCKDTINQSNTEKKYAIWAKGAETRMSKKPFSSHLLPLFQNESSYETIHACSFSCKSNSFS